VDSDVNWFTPQISIVYYTLVEPIITSAVFNTAYWVGGAIDFVQGLTNVFNDTVNAGIGFVNAEISWFLSFLPPLPPLPFFPSRRCRRPSWKSRAPAHSVQIEATDELTLTGASSESTESGEPGGEPTPETTEPVTAETPPTEPVTEGEEIPPTEPVVGEQAPGEPAGLPDEGEGEGEQDLDGAEEDLDPEPLNEPAEGDEDLSDDLGDDDLATRTSSTNPRTSSAMISVTIRPTATTGTKAASRTRRRAPPRPPRPDPPRTELCTVRIAQRDGPCTNHEERRNTNAGGSTPATINSRTA
jgi:hypothetical protein